MYVCSRSRKDPTTLCRPSTFAQLGTKDCHLTVDNSRAKGAEEFFLFVFVGEYIHLSSCTVPQGLCTNSRCKNKCPY